MSKDNKLQLTHKEWTRIEKYEMLWLFRTDGNLLELGEYEIYDKTQIKLGNISLVSKFYNPSYEPIHLDDAFGYASNDVIFSLNLDSDLVSEDEMYLDGDTYGALQSLPNTVKPTIYKIEITQ